MMRIIHGIACAVVLALAAAFGVSSAQATIVQYDFTDAASFGGVDGNNTFGPVTTDGSSMTLSSMAGQPMTFNSGGAEPAGCVAATTTLACDGDGIGIQGGANDDQIDFIGASTEGLFISFNRRKIVNLISIELLDLVLSEAEEAIVTYNLAAGGATLAAQSENGYAFFSTPFSDISTIFFASIVADSDFAIARLNIEVVPEPMTLSLVAGGLAGMAWMRRRRRTA